MHDGDDVDVEAFERATNRRRRIKFTILGLVLISPFVWLGWTIYSRNKRANEIEEADRLAEMLSPAEHARATQALDAIQARLEKVGPGFATLTEAALTVIDGGEDRCRIDARGLYVVTLADGPLRCESCRAAAEFIVETRPRLADGTFRKSELSSLDHYARAGTALIVKFTYREDPQIIRPDFGKNPGLEYQPGRIEGRVWLYDADTARVACAGRFEATNKSDLEFHYAVGQNDFDGGSIKRDIAARDALDADLLVQAKRAAAMAVRAVP